MIAPLRSWYSFRRGVTSPAELARGVARSGFSGGVLADPGVASGQLEFMEECGKQGVTGAAGVELEIDGAPTVFIAMDGGWGSLCRLVTAVHLPRRVSPEEALESGTDLAAVTGSPAEAIVLRDRLGFGGEIFVEVLPGCLSRRAPADAEREIMDAGCRPLALWPVLFTRKEQVGAHRVLRRGYLAIEGEKQALEEFASEQNVMPDAGMFRRSFWKAARSLENNTRLAEALPGQPSVRCRDRLRVTGEERLLAEIAVERLATLYRGSPAALRRMEMELSAISENGLAGYFLRFFEIVEHCRQNGIAVSARGSAGGSIVAYLLGISIICPIQHGLSFSRFFNTLRTSPPDIDLDLDSSMRDRVIDWFLEKSGRRGAAVSQTVTHRHRSAFRVAAAGLGMGSGEIDTLSGLIRSRDNRVWRRPEAKRALEASLPLRGIPSHLAPHPCGFVCAQGPVDCIVPLHTSASGYPVTHFDKDGVEEMGLLKMDLLGQRGLTTVSVACDRLGGSPMSVFRRGGGIPPQAREMLDRGETIGVVHVESPAMRGLLREMRVRTMEDVARALALVRPGASAGGGRRDYLECLRSGEMLDSCLPELRAALRENLGVMLYQEDVSRAAEELLGLDEASADLLRRKLKRREVKEEEIISICRRRCMGPEKAGAVWKTLSGYAGYGFCKAHAFTYGAVACGAAILKSEHPAIYMAAVMAAGGGFYAPRVYLEEARRLGIGFQPPGVNTGGWLTRERDGTIIPGFHHLRGMGATEYEKLRKGRPYDRPSQVPGSGCGMALCRNMAAAGCFGEIGFSPPEALMELEAGDGGFFPGPPSGAPRLPDYSTRTRVAMELGLLGLPLSANPLELLPRPEGTVPLRRAPDSGSFSIWGRFVTGRRLAGGAGFLMLEDGSGVADLFLPAPLFRRAMSILVRPEATVIVRGRVERGNRMRGREVRPGPLSVPPLAPEPPGKQERKHAGRI
ncbi:MAG: hypothetical protein R6U39_08235 [Candidatus Aegiribacteria sp.]